MRKIIYAMKGELWEIFDYLHRHPEVSWEEWKTTRFIEQQLIQEGYRTQTFSDCPGVIGEIGSGTFTVGLRSDMDALWQEVDGVWRANHACGHDAHMTMVLGVAKLFNRIGYQPPGTLRLLFQPAEEKGTGALKFLEKGVADDMDFLYGVHLRPIQEVKSGYAAPAILHGAAQYIEGEIKGVAAHAARPHLGVNVIEVGSAIVQELGKIHVDPQVPASIKMTRFRAGGKNVNIIPDYAEFALDLRAQTNEVMEQLVERLNDIVKGVAAIYHADIRLRSGVRVAAAKPHPQARSFMERAIAAVLGREKCLPPIVTSGGEDFHFYSWMKPQLKTTMLGLGCDLTPGLHHPQMTFRREDLLSGIEILARAVMETFEHFALQGEMGSARFAAKN
ncbi:M20 peptidase aminoacylase family protein [Parageobacillus thermoglucosidasius]|uniref:M20 peptidase aminoacylase family protein n=1 Tax=Parageobacillus thermoglucosidasius TaxID=1426 RepID=A0AB38R0F5_PARTM|nr:M20 peptidase aminoacylase family protein [Parageobacillus thermoglucosidasius]UOE77194.1 M20 peptidase aminoacylase family protein [Parageobacillus thermoglucosidasius]